MITAWRLLKTRHLPHAFDGEGARLYGGRWNSPGVAMTYCSATASLAVLEVFANLQKPDLLSHYSIISCAFAEELLEEVPLSELPMNWRQSPSPPELRKIGDSWLEDARSAVLAVPSAIVEQERNYLLNPNHREFRRMRIGAAEPFAFDLRLLHKS